VRGAIWYLIRKDHFETTGEKTSAVKVGRLGHLIQMTVLTIAKNFDCKVGKKIPQRQRKVSGGSFMEYSSLSSRSRLHVSGSYLHSGEFTDFTTDRDVENQPNAENHVVTADIPGSDFRSQLVRRVRVKLESMIIEKTEVLNETLNEHIKSQFTNLLESAYDEIASNSINPISTVQPEMLHTH
jgi:hypothetical protein